jgi:hypothetical protein
MGFCEQTPRLGELSFFPLLDERLDEKYHRVVSAMIDDRRSMIDDR